MIYSNSNLKNSIDSLITKHYSTNIVRVKYFSILVENGSRKHYDLKSFLKTC